jgi:HD superfamily phosphohydrolase
MEIRDPVHGSIELSENEVAVLDTPAYQRLRAIKQLGFSEFSFPGATHNRYLHSIGVCHLASLAFDSIFKKFEFSSPDFVRRIRQTMRLAALLHDIGHGPLSHATEEVMPRLRDLDVHVYGQRRQDLRFNHPKETLDRKSNHEDYTIKFVTDSSLAAVLRERFSEFEPIHVACLIDKTLQCPDDFYKHNGFDFRTILSQIVSSEMDADRLDYLERDAYFCGTTYGRVELEWLISNLTYHAVESQLHLALNRRALYTFDDFLLSRHHMHLMVYFHHKSIIYEEMLLRYLTSPECVFTLPAAIEDYIGCTDYALYQHLAQQTNPWARRIVERKPYRMLFELHSINETDRPERASATLQSEGIDVILASSMARLSKYHTLTPEERAFAIYVVDQYDPRSQPYPIESSTEIFKKYEEIRRIDRLYVNPDQFTAAEKIFKSNHL